MFKGSKSAKRISDLEAQITTLKSQVAMGKSEIAIINERRKHERAALELIVARGDAIRVPNGSTKVFGRIAAAGLLGGDLELASANPRLVA